MDEKTEKRLQKRLKALEKLVAQAQELNMGYEKKMKILIMSRLMAENEGIINANCQEPYAWISISGPEDLADDNAPKPVQNKLCKGICQLFFDDITKEYEGKPWKLMDLEQAKEIIDFVDGIKNDVTLICVHCEAGISRSSAVAWAISLWLNEHDSGIPATHSYYPNIHVKSMIMRVLRERQEVGERVVYIASGSAGMCGNCEFLKINRPLGGWKDHEIQGKTFECTHKVQPEGVENMHLKGGCENYKNGSCKRDCGSEKFSF